MNAARKPRLAKPESAKSESVKSALRVLEMLELFAVASEPLGVSQLARDMDIPKSSAQGLLNTLVSKNYLTREHSGYRLAPGLGTGSAWVGGVHARLANLATPVMRAAAEASGESAFLSVMTRQFRMRFVSKVVSRNEVRYDAALTHTRAAYNTSSGLVILAYRPEAEVAAFFRKVPREAATSHTVIEERELRRIIARANRNGYADVRDSHALGVSGVSAPILDRQGLAIAALTLGAPTWRFTKARAAMIKQVLKGAVELTRALNSGAVVTDKMAA